MVTKVINVSNEVNLFSIDIYHQIKINIDKKNNSCLIIGMVLLKEKLIDRIVFCFDNFKISLDLGEMNFSSCNIVDINNNHFHGIISYNQVDYVLNYLLQFYRDDFAPTEHIDIEFQPTSDNNEVMITLFCESYRLYSSEEISKKIIGTD